MWNKIHLTEIVCDVSTPNTERSVWSERSNSIRDFGFFFLTAGEISDGAAVHTDHSNINNILSANL